MKRRMISRKLHNRTREARERVLKAARRKGVISHELACTVGGFNQAWYHLHAMEQAGELKRAGYNQWVPA